MDDYKELLQKAILYSVKKHSKQFRKGNGAPYIIHPMAVMAILYDIKSSQNMDMLAICTILHDVVEDCNVSLQKIAKKFGYQVSSIVNELTSLEYGIAVYGKTEYLKHKMLKMSNYALTIKLCDRLHNIMDRKTFDDYMVQTEEIINALVNQRNLTASQEEVINRIRKILNQVERPQIA